MDFKEVLKYYSGENVRRDIAEYCIDRWVAIEGVGQEGYRVFIRYDSDGKPLTVKSSSEVVDVIRRYGGLKPRTIYASVNLYSNLQSVDDINNLSRIVYTSPIWDIDGSIENWKFTIEAARLIADFLEREGIEKSIFLKWSGRGVHVHVHEKAFSKSLLSKYNPLDIAYSIVEYTLRRLKEKILDIALKTKSTSRPLKVENEIDLKRVFTAPLSLHREIDLCCVCFKPDEIDSFDIEWAKPNVLRHNSTWRNYIEGEGDLLAEKALNEVGRYPGWIETKGVRTIVTEPIEKTKTARIGRFEVMALLQAARYYLLTGNIDRAKSFGLNRAIFYAWAKKHVKTKTPSKTGIETYTEGSMEYIGDEGAYISRNGYFMIGNEEQKPVDYDRQVAKRISLIVPYEKAWETALEYLKGIPKTTLLSQQKFFNRVYEPVRDSFIEIIRKREKQKTLF
ncbi:MAG: hypothetical protein QXP91_06075 [Candidatus Methanomethylicia archaeon]